MLSKMLRGSVNNTTNPVATDANFKQVSLLLHGDGTNGAQNNTFLDSSTNNFTVTRNGNTTQGTNTPFSQAAGYWSNYSDNSNYVSVPANAALSQGTGNFTYECWVYLSAYGGSQNVFEQPTATFYINNSGYMTLYTSTQGNQSGNIVVPLNSWNHVAWVRSSGTLQMYVNGVSSFSASNTKDIQSTGAMPIGHFVNGASYMSNARITNTVVYTSSFTPATTPLTAISGTALLTCQSNYFKDNSSNNFTLTVTGTPSVQPFSPFAPTSAYSTSVNGGSMYFDGVGDYLNVATNAAFTYGLSDFTMECWVYLTTTGAIQYIIDQRNSGTANAVIPAIYVSASNVLTYFVSNAAQITGTTALTVGTWYHVAVSRATLSTKMFLNGVQEGSTYTDANSYVASRVVVASNAATVGNYLTGYTSNVRLVNGTAVYTTAFTPPTAPLTAITNTSLLLSGTNAGIYDNAIKNDLETVGDAQISTAVVKYGTGSMKFDGTGDWLAMTSQPPTYLSTGAFTIEAWVYPNSNNNGVVISRRASAAARGFFLSYGNVASQKFFFYCGDTTGDWDVKIDSTSTFSSSQWYHVAVTRSASDVFTLWVNGTSQGTATNSVVIADDTSTLFVGSIDADTSFNGYIDDLRITKGVARYTTTFTPPTAAFPNQ